MNTNHRKRSIIDQMIHVLRENKAFGESKRAYKKSHNGDCGSKIYSHGNMDKLKETAVGFGKFIKAKYPFVKELSDVSVLMAQEWINANLNNWDFATIKKNRSNIIQIFERAKKIYPYLVVDFSKLVIPENISHDKIRIRAMSLEDIELLLDSYRSRGSYSCGYWAIEIARRTGLRVREIECLSPENINLEKKVLEIREGAKNGKWRDVPIREKDIEFFAELKEKRKYASHVVGATAKSINNSIRREMKAVSISNVYEDTSIHSIRKTYALERMREERKKIIAEHPEYDSVMIEKIAWERVQRELGHGDKKREALYDAYVGSPTDYEATRYDY